MFRVFNKTENLFTNIIITNNEVPIYLTKNIKSIPISNKYFLTLLDNKKDDIKSFFDYINDDTRSIEYPFKKNKNIDYSFMVEIEQFYQIDLENSNLKEISNNLDIFFQICKESDGEIVFVLDINYLIENFVKSKNVCPNHLIDFILWKLKNKVTYILVLDTNTIVKKYNNLLFAQLETCFQNYDLKKYNFEKNILVYKDIQEEVYENIYWKLLYPEIKINEHIKKIKSPYGESEFNIVKINNKECFLSKINLSDIIEKNLLNLHNDPGIIIEPVDRINIFYN
jgi:hypothetical protein